MSDVNRIRAARLMREQGLDAIVLAKPESFAWATGAHAGVAAFFRRAGAAMALLPVDVAASIAAITTELFAPAARKALGEANVLTHPDWVETADIRPWLDTSESAAALTERSHRGSARVAGFARPATFDARLAFQQLGELLRARGLTDARIGLDLDFWPVIDFQHLCAVLPRVRWVDASATITAIKLIKSANEIAKLNTAAALAEAGMRVAIDAIHEGISRDAIAAAWKSGVAAAIERTGSRITGQWEYTTVGPLPWAGGNPIVRRGDVIKFDVGCLVEGYSSDSGRTFTCGPARPRTREIMSVLADAFAAGIEVLKPGYSMRDVHERATQVIRRAGFTSFTRGHFGHSLGHDTFCEVAPFMAYDANVPMESDMVLAFETPFYVDGEGGFIIEDQVLITERGATPAWTLPRGLVELG
jgi:Xaa-Pro aminopeptidase